MIKQNHHTVTSQTPAIRTRKEMDVEIFIKRKQYAIHSLTSIISILDPTTKPEALHILNQMLTSIELCNFRLGFETNKKLLQEPVAKIESVFCEIGALVGRRVGRVLEESDMRELRRLQRELDGLKGCPKVYGIVTHSNVKDSFWPIDSDSLASLQQISSEGSLYPNILQLQ